MANMKLGLQMQTLNWPKVERALACSILFVAVGGCDRKNTKIIRAETLPKTDTAMSMFLISSRNKSIYSVV